MSTSEVRARIILCLERIGFILNDNLDDIDISEYITDSVEFVQFLVEMEEEFSIEIPDSLLGIEVLKSLEGLSNMILELIDASVG